MNNRFAILGLVGWLAVTFVAAALGTLATNTSVGDWYQTLAKPAGTPPDWVFAPVWTTLYALMAVAAWLVWRQGGFNTARHALTLFLVQLALNTLWSVVFFGLRNPTIAAVEIVILWFAILATLIAFWHKSRIAALLLVPYLAWVTYAAGLNIAIARLNA